MSNAARVNAYQTNIVESRAAMIAAQEKFGRLKDAGLISWGKIRLKSGSEYEGWLVRGKEADDAFTERARVGSDLMHWMRLLAEETASPLPTKTTTSIAVTEEEKRAFVEKWKGELEARAPSDVAPAPPAAPDTRLPPEKDDDDTIPF